MAAPISVATASTASIAGRSPETTMLPGPSRLAFQSPPSGATRAHSSSIAASSSPRTLAIPLGEARAAACIARPRRWTTFRPVSKSIAPAKTSAVYSPRLWPAAPAAEVRTSGFSALSDSRAARLATKMAGWLTSVASRASAGPSKQAAFRSKPSSSLGAVEERTGGGKLVVEALAHADSLGALARETETRPSTSDVLRLGRRFRARRAPPPPPRSAGAAVSCATN